MRCREQLLTGPGLVPSDPPRIPLGDRHPPPQRAWKIAVRRHHPRGESLLAHRSPARESGRGPLLARRRRPRPARASAPERPAPLARGPCPARPAALVEALAVYFDPDTSPEEVMAFQAMAGVLTPAKCPSELFVLTRKRPTGGRVCRDGLRLPTACGREPFPRSPHLTSRTEDPDTSASARDPRPRGLSIVSPVSRAAPWPA